MRLRPRPKKASLLGEKHEMFDLGTDTVTIRYGLEMNSDKRKEPHSEFVDEEIHAYGVSNTACHVPAKAAEIRCIGGKPWGLFRNWQIKTFESVYVMLNGMPTNMNSWEQIYDKDVISLGEPSNSESYKFRVSIKPVQL